MNRVLIIGHRGAPTEAPENTMAAFRRAAEAGVDMIELDIRRSADGRGVVVHDKKVDRTTNDTGKVSGYSEDRLRELDAGSWFGKKFAGEKIPTLDEVLDWAKSAGVQVNIEIKDAEIEEFAVKRIKSHEMLDNVILSAWRAEPLVRARELEPAIKIAPILITPLRLKKIAAELKPDYAALWCGPTLTRSTVLGANSMGIKVIAWVVNSPALIERTISRGVHGIITDEATMVCNTWK